MRSMQRGECVPLQASARFVPPLWWQVWPSRSDPGRHRAGKPSIKLPVGFVPPDTVMLLDEEDERVPATFDLFQVVVGELTPVLFGLLFELGPCPCETM